MTRGLKKENMNKSKSISSLQTQWEDGSANGVPRNSPNAIVPGFTWVWSLYHNNAEWGTDIVGRFHCAPCVATQSISKYFLSFLWPQWSHTDAYLLSSTFQSMLSSQSQGTGFYWDYKKFPPTVCSYPLYPILSPCTYKELLTILV